MLSRGPTSKQRSGYVWERYPGTGIWYARVRVTDLDGKVKDIWRKGGNKSQAKNVLKQLLRELDEGPEILTGDSMRFTELARWYRDNVAVPAVYVDGQKLSGLRRYRDVHAFLKPVEEYFGYRRIRKITYPDLAAYKRHRAETPKRNGKHRTLACIHRELEVMRRVLNAG